MRPFLFIRSASAFQVSFEQSMEFRFRTLAEPPEPVRTFGDEYFFPWPASLSDEGELFPRRVLGRMANPSGEIPQPGSRDKPDFFLGWGQGEVIPKKNRLQTLFFLELAVEFAKKGDTVILIPGPWVFSIEGNDTDPLLWPRPHPVLKLAEEVTDGIFLVPSLVFKADEVGELPVAEKDGQILTGVRLRESEGGGILAQAFPKDVLIGHGIRESGLGYGLRHFLADASFGRPETDGTLTKDLPEVLPALLYLRSGVFRVTKREGGHYRLSAHRKVKKKRKKRVIVSGGCQFHSALKPESLIERKNLSGNAFLQPE